MVPAHLASPPPVGRPDWVLLRRSAMKSPRRQPRKEPASPCATASPGHARVQQKGAQSAQVSRVCALHRTVAVPFPGLWGPLNRTLGARFPVTTLRVTRERVYHLSSF